MHFLVIDRRFCVPIFVFLEIDPTAGACCPNLPGHWVTLEPAAQSELGFRPKTLRLGDSASIGGDPNRLDSFAEFPTDRAVHAAGFMLIEPRYVGPSWETYLGVFHPQGGKGAMVSKHHRQVGR